MKITEEEDILTLSAMKPLPMRLTLLLVLVLSPAILFGMIYLSYGEISMAIFDKNAIFVIIEIAFLCLVPPPIIFIISLFLRWEKLVFNKGNQILSYHRGFAFFQKERRTMLRDVLGIYATRLDHHEQANPQQKGRWILNIILSQVEHGIDEPRMLPFPDSKYIYKERETHVRYLALKVGKFLNVPVKSVDTDKLHDAVTVAPSRAEREAEKAAAKPASLDWLWLLLNGFAIGALMGYGLHDVIQRQFNQESENLLAPPKRQTGQAQQSLGGAAKEGIQTIQQLREGKGELPGGMSQQELEELGIDPALINRFDDSVDPKNAAEAIEQFKQKEKQKQEALKALDEM